MLVMVRTGNDSIHNIKHTNLSSTEKQGKTVKNSNRTVATHVHYFRQMVLVSLSYRVKTGSPCVVRANKGPLQRGPKKHIRENPHNYFFHRSATSHGKTTVHTTNHKFDKAKYANRLYVYVYRSFFLQKTHKGNDHEGIQTTKTKPSNSDNSKTVFF